MRKKLKYVNVYYSDGSKISTSMNPNLSDREVKNYFKIGRNFNIGNVSDKMARVKKVKIIR